MVPTFDALRIELAWTGWRDVTVFTDYRPESNEVLLLCRKTDELPGRRRRGRSRPAATRAGRRRVSPRSPPPLTLAGIVLAAAALWGTLGQQIDVPTVFGDELIHWDASRSLADGDGIRVRDGGYGFGPATRRCSRRCTCSRATTSTAYQWARLLNAARSSRSPRCRPICSPAGCSSAGLEPRVRGARGCDPVRALHGVRDDRGRRVPGVHARAARLRALPRAAHGSRRSSFALGAIGLAASRAAPARRPRRRARRRARRSARSSLAGRDVASRDDVAPALAAAARPRSGAAPRSPCGPRSEIRSTATATCGARTTSSRSSAGPGGHSPVSACTWRSIPLVVAPAALGSLAAGGPPGLSRRPPRSSRSSSPVNVALLARRRRVLEHRVRRRVPPRPLPVLRRSALDRLDRGLGRARARRCGRSGSPSARRRDCCAARDAAAVPAERRRWPAVRRDRERAAVRARGGARLLRAAALVARRRRRRRRSPRRRAHAASVLGGARPARGRLPPQRRRSPGTRGSTRLANVTFAPMDASDRRRGSTARSPRVPRSRPSPAGSRSRRATRCD